MTYRMLGKKNHWIYKLPCSDDDISSTDSSLEIPNELFLLPDAETF